MAGDRFPQMGVRSSTLSTHPVKFARCDLLDFLHTFRGGLGQNNSARDECVDLGSEIGVAEREIGPTGGREANQITHWSRRRVVLPRPRRLGGGPPECAPVRISERFANCLRNAETIFCA